MRYRRFKRVERSLVRDSASLYTTVYNSQRMARIRQTGTTPELRVRRACTLLGMHYRIQNRDLPGSPDLANRSRRWVIFVHGCYWHRHEGCYRSTIPKTNQTYWLAKFERNCARDREVCAALQARKYSVLIVWECETEDALGLYNILRVFADRVG